MGLWILLALQLAATGLGFFYLWRRQRALSDEVVRLRAQLAGAERAAPRRRVRGGAVAPVDADIIAIDTTSRAARAWEAPSDALARDEQDISYGAFRGLGLGAAALIPALGFFAGMSAAVVVAGGLAVALAMTLLGLRYEWRAAAWAGWITATGWALLGFATGAAQASPITYSVFLTFCGVAGVIHAHVRRAHAGSATALAMATMALALASQVGVIGPAGAAFGLIVTAAAIVGSLSLRLEAVHLAAFGAALVGLFVLSGQDAAAIWFTPAAAWAGALFLAIAFIRVPQLGARAVAIAGTGALAPLLAIGALHWAQHGLADRFAAAGAFAVLAIALGGLIALAALRREAGLAALRVTLWVLSIGVFVALSAAILLALPAPLAASAFAATALGLAVLNARLPDAAWRTFACLAAMAVGVMALASAQMLLAELSGWNAWLLVLTGLALPAALLGAGATFTHPAGARITTATFEVLVFALAVAAASLAVRLLFSAGATLLSPVSFVEAGVHISVWLAAALLLASRSRRGAGAARMAAATTLSLAALVAAAFAGGLWLTPYWIERAAAETAPLQHAPFGFLLPAFLAWAHWVFWRARGAEVRTRTAFAAGAAMAAGFIALEALGNDGLPDWARALIIAATIALAIIINFAPGVVGSAPPRSHREENLHRDRRRQQRA